MRYYSASEFKSYIDCPYRWKKTFVDDRKSLDLDNDEYTNIVSNKYLDFGIYIHACLYEYNSTGGGDIFVIAKKLLNKHKGITVDAFIRAKDVLTSFVNRDYNIIDKLIEAEHKFEFVCDNGVPLRGTIDAIYKNKKEIVVVDFKSGYNQYTDDYIKSDLQMMIYTLFAKHKYPDMKVSVILDNLNYEPISYEYSNDELEMCKSYLAEKYTAITKEEKCEPRLNQFCGWCGQYLNCPLLKQLESIKANPYSDIDVKDINAVAKRYIQINNSIKLLETDKTRFYGLLTNHAKANDGEWSNKEISVMIKKGKLYVKDIKKN